MKSAERLSRFSVKESFDNLPSGVCFFARSGILTLCNLAMYRLAYALTGRELQSVRDLDEALEDPARFGPVRRDQESYLFPDETVWRFRKSEVRGGRRAYTEYVASDVTALFRAARELAEKNRSLAEMAARTQAITDNVAAIMREEELLSMKMCVHNELGGSVLAARQYFLGGCQGGQKQALLCRWRGTLGQLRGGLGNDEEADPYRELQAAANAIGAGIVFSGEPPEHPPASRLLAAAIRECLTNTVRHAGGSRVFVSVQNFGDFSEAVITNDGRPPQSKIAEGGGLSSLRARVEKAGGAMTVQSLPAFSLTVRIPLKGDELLDERADCGR
jgi:hypothetical protein